MPRGGKRPGAGRKTLKFGFRQWCREIVMDEAVQKAIKTHAKENAEFALKVAEHGFGRPGQTLDLNVNEQHDDQSTYQAEFEDGSPLRATGS